MKKIIVLILTLLLTKPILAQVLLDKPEVYIGLNAGAVASMVNFNPTIEQNILNPMIGSNFGISWRYIAERNVGVQAELNFTQRGWVESQTNYMRTLNYLELPFMTHIYFGKKFQGIINLGPKISFLLSDNQQNLPTNSTQPQYKTIDNRFDYGLCLGLGMQLNTNAGVYQLEARGNYSFGGIFSSRKADYFDFSNHINLSLNLGWFWKVK